MTQKLSTIEKAVNQTRSYLTNAVKILSNALNTANIKVPIEDCPPSGFTAGIYFLVSSSQELNQSQVFCDTTTDGGGWIVFQRRQDGSVDFFRGWKEYKEGFGSPSSEFWWGLEQLHAATHNKPRELRIEMESFSGKKVYAHYTSFSIASESDTYAITVSGYSGTAGYDALRYYNGKPFTTKDRDHDEASYNCAVRYTGAWWFRDCFSSHLNGKYVPAGGSSRWREGPVWFGFNEYSALKFTEMKIR